MSKTIKDIECYTKWIKDNTNNSMFAMSSFIYCGKKRAMVYKLLNYVKV